MGDVNRVDKPCVILAGAGTGKTYTIVEKLKHLVRSKTFRPGRIVCITFSNEAANTISMRVRSALGEDEEAPIIRTFHGFSADLLREHGDKIGISKEFKILDDDGAKIVLHSSLKVMPYNCHKYIGAMSNAKDLGISIEEMESHMKTMHSGDFASIEERKNALQFAFQTSGEKDREEKKKLVEELQKLTELVEFRRFLQAWRNYEKIKAKQHYLDYADLNHNALRLLQEHKQISSNYDYIIVDEFQDTNKVQLDMIFALASKGNVTVVGDMNQSIYRFRGAYKGNFEEFLEHYSIGRKDVFTLQSSYRSTDKILRTAHKLIEHNYADKEECFEVKSFNKREGDMIEVHEMKNSREEARKVVEIAERLMNECLRGDEICVMTRTHQQAQMIKMCLDMKGLKYCSVERPSLLKQNGVKMTMDYLTIINCLSSSSKGGEQAWWDLIYNTKFNTNDLIAISRFIKDNKQSDNLCKAIIEELPKLPLSEEGKLKARFIVERVNKFLPSAGKNIVELVEEIYGNLGFSAEDLENEEKTRHLHAFTDFVKEHTTFSGPDLRGFVHYLGIISALGIDIPVAQEEKEGIRLMTSHSTKGLEYRAVIVTNVAQKRFPMIRAQNSPFLPVHLHPEIRKLGDDQKQERLAEWEEFERAHQLHEERRLFYVACTRAKERLFFTYALDYGGKKHTESQFLDEIRYKDNPDILFMEDRDEKYPLLEVERAENSSLSLPEQQKTEKDMLFSQSGLLLFDECQKKYEYKYIFNMPDEQIVDWTAIKLGSFVHLILEDGVRENFDTEKQFIDLARIRHEDEEWKEVDLGEAETMIRVFFKRNKGKYTKDSIIEQHLYVTLDGLKFHGYADRIDRHEDGVEIIDYKTSRSNVAPKDRRWQLSLYALAASAKYGPVKALTLDMLRLEKPISFIVDENGGARAQFSDRMEGFNILDVKDELVAAARALMKAYKEGFKPCKADKHCEFCNEYVYKQ